MEDKIIDMFSFCPKGTDIDTHINFGIKHLSNELFYNKTNNDQCEHGSLEILVYVSQMRG
jgi:hypothetical protein